MRCLGNNHGLVIVFVLIVFVALVSVAAAFWYMMNSDMKSSGRTLADAQAFYIAEAGRAAARQAITTGGQAVPWTATNVSFGGGVYTVSAVYSDAPTNQHVTITSDGYLPSSTSPIAKRRVVEKSILYSATGINLSLAASATSSPYQGQNVPAQAIDGILTTGWVSSVKASSWLQLDYGSAKTLARVNIMGNKITSITVQYSNNGTSWTTVSTGPLGTQTFTSVSARYLKLVITSGANEKAQVDEYMSYSAASATPTLDKGPSVTSL